MTDHPIFVGESTPATQAELAKVYGYFNLLPVAVAVFLGPSQVVDFVNPAYCQLISKNASDVLGKSLFSIYPELKGSGIDEIHQRVMRTGIAEQIEENPASYLVNGVLYHGYFNTRFQPLQDEQGQTIGLLVSGYDVTETVKAKKRNEQREELLQKAKEQMELGINTGRVGLWYWDALTDTLSWSQEQLQLFGLTDHTGINRVADFHRFVLPEDLQQMYESQEGIQAATTDYAYKFRIRRADGALRWLQARSRTSFDPSGNLVYISGINIDITEQEEIRQQLEASERRFRSLAENSPDVITRHGRDFHYLYVSPQIESYTGHKPEEFLGRSYQEVGFPDSLCRVFDEALAYVFSTGRKHQVSYSMPGDNRHVFSRFTPELDENGAVDSVLIISTDITEIKKTELEQRKLATQLQLATDSANVGTWWYNVQTGELEWSALHKKMWGYPEDRSGFVFADWHNCIHQADQGEVLALMEQSKAQGLQFNATYRIEPAGGSRRWIRSVGQYQFNEKGEALAVTGISIDITEQKLVEEQLKAKEEHLSLALEGGELGTYDFYLQSGQVVWSEKTRSFFGVDFEAPVTLELFYKAIHPDDRDRIVATTTGAMQFGSGGNFDEEFRVVHLQDGQIRWIRSRGRVFFDETGQPRRFIGVVQKVSRYKEIMAQLQEGRERLQAALNASNTGTFRWNIQTNELSWDENLDRLFGLRQGEKVQNLDEFMSCVHPGDRDRVAAACRRCALEAADFDESFRVVWPDGSIHWLADKGKTLTSADGKPLFLTGACVDITERKQSEQALAANEERFRTLGNSSAQLAWMADANGFIYWYNDRWYAYTGSDLAIMQGWGWQQVHHPDHVSRVVSFVQAAWTKDEPWELTFPLRRHDGVYRWFLTRAYPIKDAEGKVVQWIGTNTDINEQLETQQALRQSESELRVLADFQPQIVWTANKAGLLDYINKRWEEFTGSPSEAAFGAGWHHWVHADDLEVALASWNLSVATGQYYEVESRIRRHDGVYRWYLNRGQALHDEKGNIIKWLGTITDIHDRKTMAVQLEALVKERTRALQRSNEDLQQFAHVASHDLKEPVRKMKTFSSMLEMELGQNLSARAKTYFEKMNSATDRMFSMISGVLAYSTFNAVEETFQPVNLNVILEQIGADLELPMQEKGAILEVGQMPNVSGVPLLLYQLFYNLINNSLKFTRTGVIPIITITAETGTLHKSPAAIIKVADNGIGFDQQYAGQIFNTFTRLHSKDDFEGNGLGLALCKKIAERHGGTITAVGVEGRGATFTVVLPR
ncbi:PAS domain S-box-containing protein [Cnuella takakiae]|uniref:histidine kinase n=1 Tax=Cnuella takakiae TaxID=1302690 RepID=A0A1M5FLK9_9BACT|nr:PAS domain-containing protein [Cnuella takakiae]OLY93720.1 hypothetical protein BUE76_18905 [Cnuella takakiae]SHF92410.1 PAS domain S-box-containing protein [Cnuella takakiae]